jgi:hypothetical protein
MATLAKWDTNIAQREYLLFWNNSTDRFNWLVSSDGVGNTPVIASTFGAPSLATWYQIICWHDAAANQIGISVNDGSANTASHTTGVFDSTAPFRIGAQGGGAPSTGSYWDGLLSKCRFWKRVLTSGERTQLYNAGAGLAYASFGGGGGGNRRRRLLIGAV